MASAVVYTQDMLARACGNGTRNTEVSTLLLKTKNCKVECCKVECCGTNICQPYPVAITIDAIWTILAATFAFLPKEPFGLPESSRDFFMISASIPVGAFMTVFIISVIMGVILGLKKCCYDKA